MTISPKVEQVADAVLADLSDRSGVGAEIDGIRSSDPETWEQIRWAIGRAAIEAMRVPTEGMIEAGDGEAGWWEDSSPDVVWRTMIAAALSEAPTSAPAPAAADTRGSSSSPPRESD